MSTTIVTLDDGQRDVWADAQQDAWMDELIDDDPVFDLACGLADNNDGTPFEVCYAQASRMLGSLASFAQDWDMHAWLGGNEAAALF